MRVKHATQHPARHPPQTQGNPSNRTNQAQPQGHPDTAYATSATTHSNHTPHGAHSRAARNALITAQPQGNGNHQDTPHTGRAHPGDAESRPDVAETRKRQESHKLRLEAPKEVKNRHQNSACGTLADSRGIEPHPNNSSEPISSRTLHLAGLLSKRRGNKHGEQEQRTKTRNKTRAPTATRKHAPQRHQL